MPDEPDEVPAQSTSGSLSPGRKVGQGRFTLKKILGQGGMGMVWLAQDEHLQELVALKFLPPQIQFDEAALAQLRRETIRSRKLSHPNIIRIHDLHQHKGEHPFIAMEYVDGPTLHALRFSLPSQTLTWAQLAPLTKQLCDALDYAHGEKIIHRDLKPSNLMLDSNGRLKLADFGIATAISDSVSRISGAGAGTPAYMSPQQVDGKPPQPTDDIYSLGATLYELLTSTPPFYRGQIVHQVLNIEASPPTARLQELVVENVIPPDVEAMIMACLAKDPSRRPQSARAVADWIGFQPTPHPRSLEATVTPPGEQSDAREAATPSRKGLRIGIALFLLVALGPGIWLLSVRLHRSTGQSSPQPGVEARSSEAQQPAGSPPVTAAPQPNLTVLAINCETRDAEGQPTGLKLLGGLPPGVKQVIKVEGGKRFVELESAGSTNWLNPNFAALPLKPGWKKLKFSARIRTRNLNCNTAYGKYVGAVLTLGWWDEQWALRKDLQSAATAFVQNNTDWRVIESVATVPPGAVNAGLEINLGHASGIVDFDDIKVEVVERASPAGIQRPETNTAPAEQVILSEDFESASVGGKSSRWNWGDHTGKSMRKEGGNHFVRIEGNYWTNASSVSASLPLQPQWKQLAFSVRMRTRNLKANPISPHTGADLDIHWVGNDKWTGASSIGHLKQDMDWITRTMLRDIPPSARSVEICFSLDQAAGIADFDDVKVTVVEAGTATPAQKPQGTPANPIGIGATTTLLAPEDVLLMEDFERGKPRGTSAQPFLGDGAGMVENGKGFLRIEGKEVQQSHEFYTIIPLPPQWQELAASVRLRTKNLQTNVDFRYSGARIACDLLDEKKLKVQDAGSGLARQDADWNTYRARVYSTNAPASAKYARVSLCLQQAAGAADFTSLRVTAVQTLPAAEIFLRPALAAARRAYPTQLDKWEKNANALAETLQREGKMADAEKVLNEVLTPAVVKDPHCINLLHSRGSLLARQSRWKPAAVDFAQAINLQPTNHLHYHRLAPVLAATGDLDAYRLRCREMLAYFSHTTNWTAAHVIAKACLILPTSGIDLTAVDRLADQQIEADPESKRFAWSQLTKGLSEYRQGRFQSAVEWLEKTLTKRGTVFSRDADAYAVLAMARHRLGQSAEASAELDKGIQISQTQMPGSNDPDLGDAWLDCVTSHLLIREAKALLNSSTAAPPTPSH